MKILKICTESASHLSPTNAGAGFKFGRLCYAFQVSIDVVNLVTHKNNNNIMKFEKFKAF